MSPTEDALRDPTVLDDLGLVIGLVTALRREDYAYIADVFCGPLARRAFVQMILLLSLGLERRWPIDLDQRLAEGLAGWAVDSAMKGVDDLEQ